MKENQPIGCSVFALFFILFLLILCGFDKTCIPGALFLGGAAAAAVYPLYYLFWCRGRH